MPATVTNMDSAKILKPKLLLQLLGGIKKPETEVLDNIFRVKKNVDGDKVSRRITTRTVRAIPFVGQNRAGVPLYGKTVTDDGITTPPMKCHHRIMADDFEKIKNLLGQELRAALTEEMQYVKDTVAWNREWFARHFLNTGDCDYEFLQDDGSYEAVTYDLGTMSTTAAPGTLFDAAGATLTDVVNHLDLMFETGQDVANRNHFNEPDKIITYARKAVWNAIYDILDGKQTNSTVTGRRIDKLTLDIGGYIIKKFDADLVVPSTQAAGVGIPVKQMRMIDVGSSAPHTMANLEVANTKAKGGLKHVFILPVEDTYGDYVDIVVQHRPVGMLIPEAIVNSNDVIA
jgi:hypothetical protein